MSSLFANARPAGSDVLVTLPLLDESGAALVPTALDWRLLDESETVLQDWTTIAVETPAQAQVTLTIPGALNALAGTILYGVRLVELRVTHAGGVSTLPSLYTIERAAKLIPMVNSFGTLMQLQIAAQHLRADEVLHFDGASEDDRLRALLASYRTIMDMPLMVLSENGAEMGWLRDMPVPDRMLKVGPTMLAALRAAQVLASSDALGLPGDPAMQARLSGIVSMTVGESSQFFGTSKPLEMAISKAATRVLGRYIRHSNRIGRA